MPLREMDAGEFVRRFKNKMDKNEDSKFVFFLGAGCSISSGIPAAGGLVKTWLPRVKKLVTDDETDYEDWATKYYSGYAGTNASLFYGNVINDLCLTFEGRRREIERLTEGRDPTFGYAVLAKLMSHKDYGRKCNAVLTVNFDDLVADALYLYTHKKPLIISHDSLVGFVRLTRTRPLVIKLHGDALLEPRNTESETSQLPEQVKYVLKNFLSETGLIFVGYGGNDKSIAEILNQLPEGSLPWGIYWIGNEIPENNIGEWLKKRNAIWVKHRDFDELMFLIWNEFNFDHPDGERFDKLLDTYNQTFDKLKKRLEGKPESEIGGFSVALEKASEKPTNVWSYLFALKQLEKINPDLAESLYKEGVTKYPQNAALLGNYAFFLSKIRKDYDNAEVYFKKFLEIEPENAVNLADYAFFFLFEIRKDYDNAEVYFKKSLEIEPENAGILGNYAIFLYKIRKDYDKTEEYFKKSLEINSMDARHLGNYANFIFSTRKDYDTAEEYFKKSLEIKPDNAVHLGNYAGLLLAKGDANGFDVLLKAIKFAEVPQNDDLLLECQFYKYAHFADSSSRADALNRIRELLLNGIRSPGWDLSENVKRAIEDVHPHPEFLTQLSKVISDEIDIKELDKFEEWKEK